MIALPIGVRVWLAAGHTDMRHGMNGLARQVQETQHHSPYAGDLYVFRGAAAAAISASSSCRGRHARGSLSVSRCGVQT
jgi:transposase